MKKILLSIALLAMGQSAFAQNAEASVQKVAIENSAYFKLFSQTIQEDYYIKVFLPDGYDESNKKYPVLYLLDGDHAFAMATDITTYLGYGKHIPELIIVSPSYNDKAGPDQGGRNQRRRDFSPVSWGGVSANSSAEKYFTFLTTELIPFIEKDYKVNKEDRAIWGYSRSGLLALWALFERPGIFNKYIILDTGFHVFQEIEEKYHQKSDMLPASLFIGYGTMGNGKQDLKFMENLKQRSYKKFRYDYQALQGTDHFLIPATGLTLGLKFIYEK